MPRKPPPKIQMVDPVTGKPVAQRTLPPYRSGRQEVGRRAHIERTHNPTAKERAQVRILVSCGLTQQQIGLVLGISDPTLRKHYGDDLDHGFTMVSAQMTMRLVQKALAGDKACLIFWIKTRLGWSETNKMQLSGANGGPIDLRCLSTEELVATLGAIEGRTGGEEDPG